MTAVVWVSYRKPEIISRGYWDQGLLERAFDRRLWRTTNNRTYEHFDGFEELPDGDGAVVVVPAQHHHEDQYVDQLNADLSNLPWCLVILTGDECSLFPWRSLAHPNMKLWVMTPRPAEHFDCAARFIGEGCPADTTDVVAQIPVGTPRNTNWFFAGQVTHERRRQLVDALADCAVPGVVIETPGFTQGIGRHEYLHQLVDAKVAPCPSGPGTPDSFRLFEALEAGCLPLADAVTPEGWTGYWPFMLGEVPPFPIVKSWDDAPTFIDDALLDWPLNAAKAGAWWQQRKRQLCYDLDADVSVLTRRRPPPGGVADQLTVLMPTSLIPSHPDTTIIEQTLRSIRDQSLLSDVEIIVMIDGLRPEQADQAARYHEYVHRVVQLTNRLHNVVPMIADEHLHQGNLTRNALKFVRTPAVLFIEHDTPLIGSTPWQDLVTIVLSGTANVIRLHHETNVLQPHQHLMLDTEPRKVNEIPLLRTAQWSQRPHIASTRFYRTIIDTYFGHASRTMIEDVMHGVVDQHWRERGERGWDEFRLWMYAPPGDMKRSTHLDGRGADPKYDMVYAYDTPTPNGAPAPTSDRVD